MQDNLDPYRISAALRMARAAVGWSQVELAEKLGISKTTLARAETVDGGLRVDQLVRIQRLYKELGVSMDFFPGEDVQVTLERKGLELCMRRLNDETLRRADRKKTGVFSPASRAQKKDGPTFE